LSVAVGWEDAMGNGEAVRDEGSVSAVQAGRPQARRVVSRLAAATGLGLLVVAFIGAVMSLAAVMRGGKPPQDPWLVFPLNHLSMAFASVLLCCVVSRGNLDRYGFTRGRFRFNPRLLLWTLGGVLGAVFLSLSGAGGVMAFQDLTPVQIVVLTWLLASVAEEIYARGLIQGYLEPLRPLGLRVWRMQLSLPMLFGAAWFAALHLSVLTLGANLLTVAIIIVYAFVLGLVAGHQREKTGSLIPAVLMHSLFNIGGTAIGWLAGLW
jgi:membrane protease YdiL (CAAX protease family)